ncbi:MAG: ester cyclase [Acidimicrobiia bacterium]
MSAANEAVVRRFYEQMCNERKNEMAWELFTPGHRLHDPQVPAADGPAGVAEVIATYQENVDGHWEIEEILSAGDRVVVRWTGSGTHIGEVNGIPPTGRAIRVDAISMHRLEDGQIAETWEVWDTLGFLQQLGVVPTGP